MGIIWTHHVIAASLLGALPVGCPTADEFPLTPQEAQDLADNLEERIWTS